MIQLFEKKEECCGCEACANACLNNCIVMKTDAEGFRYPSIDDSRCIECGKCKDLCPSKNIFRGEVVSTAYAFEADAETRIKCSSGGAFALIAKYALNAGGVVFGAAFDAEFNVVMTEAENLEELQSLFGSKYVQGTTNLAYRKIKENLKVGKLVLFSGVGCQVAALKAYLRKDYDNLYTIDVACLGMPSPGVWAKYVKILELKNGGELISFSFRDKSTGWRDYSVCAEFNNGKKFVRRAYDDDYMRAFRYKMLLRPSCYTCPVKGLDRESDLTLADFWGVEKLGFDIDDQGTSLLISHSKKGEELVSLIDKKVRRAAEVDAVKAVKHNPAITHAAVEPPERHEFIMMALNKKAGLHAAVKKFCSDSLVLTLKIRLARLIKTIQSRRLDL